LKQDFTALVSASSLPSKPDPAVFLAAADALKIPNPNCLVVEDTPPGAIAARSAGMHCLVVLTTRTRPEFTTGDLFLERLSEDNPLEVLIKFDPAG
jgi:beta-phosphoglucomutase-like phosphatase (HAD superfamily)